MNDKARNWATLVYPDSAAENWVEMLQELKIPCYISPLHDMDLKPDGELKKPHYHVLITLQGQKNRDIITELVQKFGGVGAELVFDKQAYLYYLCHLKSKDKAVYNPDDVISLNVSEEYDDAIEDASKKCQLIRDMIVWCHKNTVYFCDLVDYACTQKNDWFKFLADGNNSRLIWEYLRSKNFKDS